MKGLNLIIAKSTDFGKNRGFWHEKSAKSAKSAKFMKTTKSVKSTDFNGFCGFPGQNLRISM